MRQFNFNFKFNFNFNFNYSYTIVVVLCLPLHLPLSFLPLNYCSVQAREIGLLRLAEERASLQEAAAAQLQQVFYYV